MNFSSEKQIILHYFKDYFEPREIQIFMVMRAADLSDLRYFRSRTVFADCLGIPVILVDLAVGEIRKFRFDRRMKKAWKEAGHDK